MIIDNVVLNEQGDFQFCASFLYQGHNLVTSPIDRGASPEDVKAAIRTAVDVWEQRRANQNFEQLKETIEGQSIEV